MKFQHVHGDQINAVVCEALTDCNGGRPFGCWDDWLRVGQRIGIRRIVFQPRGVVPEPMLRYDGGGPEATAVLYLPPPPCRRTLYCWLLHEFSEFIMARELNVPFCYPADWGDHHKMARVVEKYHFSNPHSVIF